MMRRVKIDTESNEGTALNLTPFLDLMLVLIPFLLLTAGFSKVVVTTAKLPAPILSPSQVPPAPPFDLVVRMPKDTIQLFLNPAGSTAKPLLSLPIPAGNGVDSATLERLHQALVEVKKANPTQTRVALDPHGTVPMERLQQVMDNLALHTPADGADAGKPLFPEIALKGVYAP